MQTVFDAIGNDSRHGHMNMLITKLCGFQKQKDIDIACKFGANFIGFVFSEDSPRYINTECFAKLDLSNIGKAKTVAVFKRPIMSMVDAVLKSNKVDYIQIHDCDYSITVECANLKPIIYAFSCTTFVAEQVAKYDFCSYFLFDNLLAGSGQERDFSFAGAIHKITKKLFFLAGGININNYRNALQYTNLIDVSSGIETIRGIKDSNKIKALLREIYNGNTH